MGLRSAVPTTGGDDREVPAVEQSLFRHEGPWTEDAYLALTGNDGRVEVDSTGERTVLQPAEQSSVD